MNIIDFLTKDMVVVDDKPFTYRSCDKCALYIGNNDCRIPRTMKCPLHGQHYERKDGKQTNARR